MSDLPSIVIDDRTAVVLERIASAKEDNLRGLLETAEADAASFKKYLLATGQENDPEALSALATLQEMPMPTGQRQLITRQETAQKERRPVVSVGVRELLEAGVHFGHQTRRWNPKMKPFIFDARNGIHIIDLSKSLAQLEIACEFLAKTVTKGGKVLFVGTKKQAQQAVKEAATEAGQYFVTERWLGGTLTNFATVKKSLARLREIEKMEADGSINNYVKQEQSMIRREAARLVKYFDGIRSLDRNPAAIFVVDVKREHNAVAEARKLKIPVVAITDTNADPDLVDYPIAGNDDAIRSVRLILKTIGQAIHQSGGEFTTKKAHLGYDETEPAVSVKDLYASAKHNAE